MSLLIVTTVKAPLASYVDLAAFRADIASTMSASITAISNGVIAGDILVYDVVYTEDATDYIGTINLDWFDQATLDSYNAVPEIAAERATLEANFDVTRV